MATDPKHLLRYFEMEKSNAREGMLNLLRWMMDLEQAAANEELQTLLSKTAPPVLDAPAAPTALTVVPPTKLPTNTPTPTPPPTNASALSKGRRLWQRVKSILPFANSIDSVVA